METPDCRDLHFTFSTTASNRVADHPPPDLFTSPEAIDAFLQQPVAYRNVSGTFVLYGQLCRPSHRASASSQTRLQLLVHGSTYNHKYWSSLQEPSEVVNTRESESYERLSWIHAATRRGYWTLAVDRLGQGRSSRPDPVTVVQAPLQTQLLHLLAQKIRKDDILNIGFSQQQHEGKLVYVGHSYGSGLGVHLAAEHPGDFDGYILTGIAAVRENANPRPGSFLARWAPAAQAFPDRFPASLPSGYLVSTNKSGRRGLYWGAPGDFDAALLERDWASQGTNPLGEVLTVGDYLAALPGVDFDKPVLVADGSADAIFCSDLGSRDLSPANCSLGDEGEIGRTRGWFPGVPPQFLATYRQPHSGHDHILHETGHQLIAYAHDWLESTGL
ncbi:alpha/beta-hydrolase [Poronia punctata]|nr:alpha/beta-hydrolase [Poronia punctata]